MKPGEVELKNVSMKYRPELKYVLENISFKVEKGKHVGIVGRTGSGKSSLFTAFYHLADVIDGQIGINGQFNMPLSKRRQSLSLIPQDRALTWSGVVRGDPGRIHFLTRAMGPRTVLWTPK